MKRWALIWLTAVAFFAPLKFGTPVELPGALVPPQTIWEWLFFSWPNQLLPLFLAGALLWLVLDWKRLPVKVDWLFVLPGIFLVTQLAASPTSICWETTKATLLHFAVCVSVFYVAARYVRDEAAAQWVFGGLAVVTLLVVGLGLRQHFGGLAETRTYAAASGENLSQNMQLRLMSNRIFSTLVYPNALAGFLVVAFAPVMVALWNCRLRNWLKWVVLISTGGLIVFCLALTGSRGGLIAFAVMVLIGLVVAARRILWALVAVALVAGVFVTARQVGWIRRGSASVSARMDYWGGAVRIACDFPWLGTGPGTFGSIYPKYKTAMTEEAQLVHNSYLQMWSDSGVAAAVVFAALWCVALWDGFKLARQRAGGWAGVAVVAALAGWVVHGAMDFDLYMPGVAVPAFLLLGILQGLKPVPERPSRRPARLAWATAGLAVGAVVVWLAGRSLAADFCNARTVALMKVEPVMALESARTTLRWDPENPRHCVVAGDLAAGQGRLAEAAEFYQAAVGNDPYRAAYHWRLARVLWWVGGHESEAVEQLRMAAQLNPTQARYRTELQAVEENIRQPGSGLLKSEPLFENRP